MIVEGLKIMLLGMGTVFVMLGTLVLSTVVASRIISATGHGPDEQAGTAGTDRTIAAAIAAAITRFRRK
jgi:Na+-transporting methylmalonyl-CoA/oxaloacetate decarboxylase gamma subunit